MLPPFSFSDVPALRNNTRPLIGTVAPAVTSENFKSPRCLQKPAAKSFTHRLNIESRARCAATLKDGAADLEKGVISLSTGRPAAEYFPFLRLAMQLPKGPPFGTASCLSTSKTIGKYDLRDGSASFDLATCLNYGYSAGSEQLLRFVTEHVEVVHDPPYSDWQCSLTIGSTSALDAAYRMFCSRGDYILTEEFTYSGAIEAARPLGLRLAPVKMDEQGLSASDLDVVLSDWDPVERGAEKPFLLYVIPTGQNPTGATQSAQRRKEIYAVAERHDLYIIEDDPYYYIHFNGEQSPIVRPEQRSDGLPNERVAEFLSRLAPSYLSLDVSGRVLRLDSTSKMLAPGLRCSWMTGASDIISRFLYHHDLSIVSPSGLSQLAIHTLLDEVWGHEGFISWLDYLRTEYLQRRDVVQGACQDLLPKEICSWQVPDAGMFYWIRIDWRAHPAAKGTNESELEVFMAVEDCIYRTALKHGVMFCKGSAFRADNEQCRELFFRATFATATLQQLVEAIRRFRKALLEEFYNA
ncbi:putative aromatic aminotransferase Aro8 [Truncatella angustata]|uniref:Aromatic aminotransferase Aro8 n=1 Tax=Truncatella angustata TaxID=152316 RepID=A0A9P9A343_9PEZI|nr:putative aromatic aminotransferase Aro8 [Truncatella angustata]KAH6658565.1 putative aromatic aminotransferase Aro8 [Truncatella angustata]